MKYMQSSMSLRGVLPASVQDWLDHELEVRGIDAVIYARYILMILQEDSPDEEQSESELFDDNAHIRSTRCHPGQFKHKNEKRKVSLLDTEERKKSAVVECLKSVSEQKIGIESLVEELCLKLKNIQSEKEHSPGSDSSVNGHKDGSESILCTSPEDLAQKYYAAFPALKTTVETIVPASLVSKSSVWCGKKIANMSLASKARLKKDLVSSDCIEEFSSVDSNYSFKRHGNTPSRYPRSGSCSKRLCSSKFSSSERHGTSNKTIGSKSRILRPAQRSRTRAKDNIYKSENLQERLNIKKCGWLNESASSIIPSVQKKDTAAVQMLKKDLLVRPPRRRVEKLITGGHSKETQKRAMHGKEVPNLDDGSENESFQGIENHLKPRIKKTLSWDQMFPVLNSSSRIVHLAKWETTERESSESQTEFKIKYETNGKNLKGSAIDIKAQTSKNNILIKNAADDQEGLSKFSEKFTADVAAIWENKPESYTRQIHHFPYWYRSTYFSLTSFKSEDDPLLDNGELIGQDLISGIQSIHLPKEFSDENLTQLDSYLSCKYSRSGLLDAGFDMATPDISVFDSFYSQNCSLFGTTRWAENKADIDSAWQRQHMFIEEGVYGSTASIPFQDDTWKTTCFDLEFLKPKIENPLLDADLKSLHFLDSESFSVNLKSVWDFEFLKNNYPDETADKKFPSLHLNKIDCKSPVLEPESDNKKLPSKDKLCHHKEKSCFIEVEQKVKKNNSPKTDTVESKSKSPILTNLTEDDEQENLLTSQRTHFRPIREESLEETLSDATTSNTDSSDEIIFDIMAGKPTFIKTDSETFCIEEEGVSPKKYMFYNGSDLTLPADEIAFIPKFRMSCLEKFCQTEEYIRRQFDETCDLEIPEAENLLALSLKNITQHKEENSEILASETTNRKSPMWECEIDILPKSLDLLEQFHESSSEINDEKTRSKSETQGFEPNFNVSLVSDIGLLTCEKWATTHNTEQHNDIVLLRDELREEEDQLLKDINSLRETILTDSEPWLEKIDLYKFESNFQIENKLSRLPLISKQDHSKHSSKSSLPFLETNFSIIAIDYEDFLSQEKENVNNNLPFIPTDKVIYSSELEESWQKDERPFDVQIPKKQPKSKQKCYKKPCSFFLEGNCRRADCKFAHDLSTITCRFWEEGGCFKGITCPFLHGYSSDELVENPKTFFSLDLDSDEFPVLSKSKEHHNSTECIPLLKEPKKKKSIT